MKSKPVSTDVAIIILCLSLRCFYRSCVLSRTEEATACFTLLVPKHTHTPLRSHQKASGMGEWVCVDLCDLLLWVFPPDEQATGELVWGSNAEKHRHIQTSPLDAHETTDRLSLIVCVYMCVFGEGTHWVNKCFNVNITHTTWTSLTCFKNACFVSSVCVCLCIHSLFLISPTSDSQTEPSDQPNAHRATNPDRTSLLRDQSEASTAYFYSTHHKYTTKVAHQHSVGLLPSIHTIHSLNCTL